MQETAQQYIERILGYVEGQDALKVQRTTAPKLKKLVQGLSPRQLQWKSDPSKWSITEILAHLSDAEIVGSWRMRSALGASGITIQSFDQDVWASLFQYGKRNPRLSLEVFRILRENNLVLLKGLPRESWDNYGMHLERGKETIAHIARMFAGHDLNHLSQIERIVAQLKDQKPKKARRALTSQYSSKSKKGASKKRRK
jgi:hypothetical protein